MEGKADSGIREIFGCGIQDPVIHPEYSSSNPDPTNYWNSEFKFY